MQRTSRRPGPPFVLNPGSPQARGLVAWYPLFGQFFPANYAWGRRRYDSVAGVIQGVGWHPALQSPGTQFNGSTDGLKPRGGYDDEGAITGQPVTLVAWHIGSAAGTGPLYGTSTGGETSTDYSGWYLHENSINFGNDTSTSSTGLAGGGVRVASGPWRTSGGWWSIDTDSEARADRAGAVGPGQHDTRAWQEGRDASAGSEASGGPRSPRALPAGRAACWDRDEWDVALGDRAVYRVFRDRRTKRWYVEGMWD